MARPCPRTIDKPLLVLGLEGEDIAALLFLFGVPAVLWAPGVPVMGLFLAWPLMARFKRGKPEGYILHLLYQWGMSLQGLLPPGMPRRYACFLTEDSDA